MHRYFDGPAEILDESANAFGLSLNIRDPEPPYEVWQENWDTWRVFISAQTQWKYLVGDRVHKIGLDYPGVKVIADALDVEDWGDVFAGVQICEAEALRVFDSQHKD